MFDLLYLPSLGACSREAARKTTTAPAQHASLEEALPCGAVFPAHRDNIKITPGEDHPSASSIERLISWTQVAGANSCLWVAGYDGKCGVMCRSRLRGVRMASALDPANEADGDGAEDAEGDE